MNPTTLRAHLKALRMAPSELARRIGVSRQAVSKWFKGGAEIGVKAAHLLAVSQVLRVRPEDLARPLPCFEGEEHPRLRARYLWDALYPDLDDFAIALRRREPHAVARLVEIDGLFSAEKILGQWVWKEFDRFKRFIHPVRRRQLETLRKWQERESPTAA
jgi:transcriptional regulator with XRE-family HTH domain